MNILKRILYLALFFLISIAFLIISAFLTELVLGIVLEEQIATLLGLLVFAIGFAHFLTYMIVYSKFSLFSNHPKSLKQLINYLLKKN